MKRLQQFLTLRLERIKALMLWATGLYIFSISVFDGTIVFYISVFFLYAIGFVYLLTRPRVLINPFILLMLLFILYNAVLMIVGVSDNNDSSVRRLITLTLNFLANIILFVYFIEKENRIKAARLFVLTAICLIIYIIICEGDLFLSKQFGYLTPYPFGLTGVNGQKYNPNSVSRVLYTAVMLIFYLYFEDQKVSVNETRKCESFRFLPYTLTFVFLSIFVLLAGSRSGIVTLVLYLFLLQFLRMKRLRNRIAIIIVFLAVIVLAYYFIINISILYELFGKRVEELVNGLLSGGNFAKRTTTYYRNNMTIDGIEFFLQRPLFGWGLDSYSSLSVYGTYSHNNFIEILVSTGIVGFILYYSAVVYIIVSCIKHRMQCEIRDERQLILAFSLATLTMHVASVVYVDRMLLFTMYLFAAATADWRHTATEVNQKEAVRYAKQ